MSHTVIFFKDAYMTANYDRLCQMHTQNHSQQQTKKMLEDPQPALAKDPTQSLTSIQTQRMLVPASESTKTNEIEQAAKTLSIDSIPLIDSYFARNKFSNKDVFIKIFRDFKSKPKYVRDCIMDEIRKTRALSDSDCFNQIIKYVVHNNNLYVVTQQCL
jgi:hypothetical protein